MIIPEGQKVVVESTPLEISTSKRTAMIAKAKELLTKPMETKELMDALEEYYVYDKNEHYTSAQLKDIVEQVASGLVPGAEEIKLEV